MNLRTLIFLVFAGFSCAMPLPAEDLPCVVIPALSPYRHLPGEQNPDGEIRNDLTILMAPNEIGHAAFLLKPVADENNVIIVPSDLRSEKGVTIPASAVDLRIVKYWYQDGTAWTSYFADPIQQELVPELLLHDENLVKVDLKNRRNYLRVGKDYRWMNYPETIRPGRFNHLTEPVADSLTLQPFSLSPAEKHKRFFLTLRADVPADIYKGTLTVKTPQKTLTTLSLTVRVLPFRLPRPKTWYNRNKTFLSAMRIEPIRNDYERLGRDLKKLEAYRLKMYRSMREHNIDYPLVSDPENYGHLSLEESLKLFRADLTWMKQCGFPSDMMIGGVKGFSWNLLYQDPKKWPAGYEEKFFGAMDRDLKIIREIFGEQIIVYPEGWNEPGMKTLQKQRPTFRKLHEKGMRVQQTGNNRHLKYGAYNTEIMNMPGRSPHDRLRAWHAMGHQVTNYAYPHTGVENPDYIRRVHGFELYKNDYDGTCNYHFLENGSGNIWRDTNGTFRTFSFVYATADGLIDTLEYEGFRAAIDDVRYATLLCQLAEKCIGTTGNVDAMYAGKQAMLFLAETRAEQDDLDMIRLEMIRHILKMQKLLEVK